MTAPKSHLFRHQYPNEVSNPREGTAGLPYYTLAEDMATALEIGPGSEVDCCKVKCPSGTYVLSVGSPIVGPLRGPFEILPWGGRTPAAWTSATSNLTGARDLPALVEIVQHFDMTTVGQIRRRAPVMRSGPVKTVPAAYDRIPLDLVPFYGRRRATIAIDVQSLDANNLSLMVVGRRFHTAFSGANLGNNRDSQDYGVSKQVNGTEFTGGIAFCALVLDATGATELTFTPASLVIPAENGIAITVEGEGFDALALHCKTAAAGWTVIPTWELLDA